MTIKIQTSLEGELVELLAYKIEHTCEPCENLHNVDNTHVIYITNHKGKIFALHEHEVDEIEDEFGNV